MVVGAGLGESPRGLRMLVRQPLPYGRGSEWGLGGREWGLGGGEEVVRSSFASHLAEDGEGGGGGVHGEADEVGDGAGDLSHAHRVGLVGGGDAGHGDQ